MTHKFIVQWLLVVTSVLPFSACALTLTYSADAIEAHIIDADTKQPLAGVIVTANWELEQGSYGGNRPIGQLVILETVTDKDGKFTFPAWGPKLALLGHLVNKDPQLLIFKSGYESQQLTNTPLANYNKSSKRHSEWHGRTIGLKPFRGTGEGKDLLRDFKNLNSSVESVIREAEACNWKKIPKMLLAIRKQKTFLIGKGITGGPFGISSVDQYLLDNSEKFAHEGGLACGSPKDFFGSN